MYIFSQQAMSVFTCALFSLIEPQLGHLCLNHSNSVFNAASLEFLRHHMDNTAFTIGMASLLLQCCQLLRGNAGDNGVHKGGLPCRTALACVTDVCS